MISFAYEVDAVWDTLTVAVCLAATYFLSRLYTAFKGGTLGAAYGKYLAAGVVLSVGFAVRVGLDLYQVDPSIYGLSIKDAVIIASLVLLAMGLRQSSKVWSRDSVAG